MRVTLDLSHLLAQGAISREEHDRLARLGRTSSGMLLISVLVGFGVIAVSAAAVILVPDPVTGLVLGALLAAVSFGLKLSRRAELFTLADICLLIAALMLGGGILLISQGVTGLDTGAERAPWFSVGHSLLIVAALFAGAAILARSALLASLTVLLLFAALGGSGAYGFAEYTLSVRRPLATVLAFSALALAAHLLSLRLRADWERLATIVARTSLLLVNLGFWIGSLWGAESSALGAVSPAAFSIAWAIALFGAAVWAGWANRRWLLNLAAVFGGVHFYTQWFEILGATPVSLLLAGLVILAFALLLQRANRMLAARTLGSRSV